jgi:SAM-dependent methyltransferase
MHKELKDYYNSVFYQNLTEGSSSSAKEVLNILYQYHRPLSVVDIGCGVGNWLNVAESLGSRKLKGYDGPWVNKDNLLSKNIDFTTIDISKEELTFKEKYDLCISVEIAEHLPESSADRFVDTLCKASEVVLFSAAVKHQGGEYHINEQWQSYWIKLFDERGFQCLDMFRPLIWDKTQVEWWYKQNIFLFIRRSANLSSINTPKNSASFIADMVHPINYVKKYRAFENLSYQIQHPTFRFCLGSMKRWLLNKLTKIKHQEIQESK